MRVGFIAMSGVRVRDTELEALGLTLPGFIDRGKTIASLPSLGLLTLAGMTPGAFDVTYLEVDALPPADALPVGEFDVVAISSFTARIDAAYELAGRYRAAGVTVLLGGLHVTMMPDEAASHADAIVVGEAEPVWGQLLQDLANGALAPRYDGTAVPFSMEDAPLPRFELLEGRSFDRFTVQTQRGCPWNCEFCAASIRLRPGFRTKPANLIAREVERVQALNSRPFIELADDNTFASVAHGHRVADVMGAAGVRWFTETDVSFADDLGLVQHVADSGCVQVLIGLESPSSAALHGVEQVRDWKSQRADRYFDAVERIQSRGISVNGCFVLGLDGAGPDQFDGVLDFVRESGLHEVQVTVQTPFPGTPLYDRLASEQRLLPAAGWAERTLFDVTFEPTDITVAELRAGLLRLTSELYTAEAVDERRRRFRSSRGVARRGSS